VGWAREAARLAALVEQQRVAAISSMLADDVFIARYWNLRQILEERAITTTTLSELTGVHFMHCGKFGSEKPSMAISNQMARRLEAGLGLEPSSLDRPAQDKVVTGETYFPVPPGAVKFLGLGPYLYRYGHIRQIIQEKGLKKRQIIKIPGFTLKGLTDVLGDSPVSLVSMKMARAFEDSLGLEPGSVDRPVGRYEIEPDHPAFLVTMEALMLIGEGESLNRYVNIRKALFIRGLSANDLADLTGLSRSTMFLVLSDQPRRSMSAKLARRAESALSLEAMSLDQAVVYKMEEQATPRQPSGSSVLSVGIQPPPMPVTLRARKDSPQSQSVMARAFASAMRSNEFTLVRALFATQKTVGMTDGNLAIMFHQHNVSEQMKQRLAQGHFSAMQQMECLAHVAMEAMAKVMCTPWTAVDMSGHFIQTLRDKHRDGQLISVDEFRSGIFAENPLSNDELKALPYLLNQYQEVYCRVRHDLERHASSCIKKLTFAGCDVAALAIQQSQVDRTSVKQKLPARETDLEDNGPGR
jgi:DNA-binding Xre family transcriptional regulator